MLGKFYLRAFAEFPKNEGHYPDLMMDLSGAVEDGVLDGPVSTRIGEFNRCYPNSRFTAREKGLANEILEEAIGCLREKLSL
jgi:hypothetical protein